MGDHTLRNLRLLRSHTTWDVAEKLALITSNLERVVRNICNCETLRSVNDDGQKAKTGDVSWLSSIMRVVLVIQVGDYYWKRLRPNIIGSAPYYVSRISWFI